MNGNDENGYVSPVNRPGNMITPGIRARGDYATESYREAKIKSEGIKQSEGAREIEEERKLWWSVGLGLLGALFGPIGVPIGVAVGKIVGEVSTVGGKQAEEYFISTDVGKFEKQQKFQLEEFNRNLETYDKSQLWTDIMDIGRAGLFSYQQGVSPTEWKPWGESVKGGATDFLNDAWKRLLPNKE